MTPTNTKETRSSKNKVKTESSSPSSAKTGKPVAYRKVFYISESLLESCEELRLEHFFHPGHERSALFVTRANETMMEVVEFSEPHRSWLVDSDVCSNGRIYVTTPFDVTFLVLHHIRKHCSKRALAIDSICDEEDASTMRVLRTFAQPEHFNCIADVKCLSNDDRYYKYNGEKAMAWLAIKVRNVSKALRGAEVYCGHSAVSQNYAQSEEIAENTEEDYLRMACDIVGNYVDVELKEALMKYFQIAEKWKSVSEEKNIKRKSLQTLSSKENKKMKLNDETGVTEKLNDSVGEQKNQEQDSSNMTPLKERPMSAKEKALAKSAKGTKSISSFFKK